jgi:hypothetical protein
MPAGVLPDEGIDTILNWILKASIAGVLPWQLMLWTNDLTPTFDTTLEDLEEATWIGYGRWNLLRENWTDASVSEGCASSTYGTEPLVWNVRNPLGQTNFGVAFVDRSAGVLRYVERFSDEDIFPLESGMEYSLLPTFTLTSAECQSAIARRTRLAKKNLRRRRNA